MKPNMGGVKAARLAMQLYPGTSTDGAYAVAAGLLGAYHVFYGHKVTPQQRRRLNDAWKTILKEYRKGS